MTDMLSANARCSRELVACFLCFCLFIAASFITTHKIQAAEGSGVVAQAKIKDLSARYTRAMNEISKIASMSLSSKAELHSALEILKRNDPDLKYISYRLIEIALENPALRKGCEDKLNGFLASNPAVQEKIKKSTLESGKLNKVDASGEVRAWIDGLKKNPNTIRDWPGVSQAQQEINNQFRRDQEILKRVAANLKRAAERKNAGFRSGPVGFGMILRPVLAKIDDSFDPIEPMLPVQVIELTFLIIYTAVVVAVVTTVAVVGTALTVCREFESKGGACVNTDPGIELLPIGPTPYEKCKTECDKWRDDCIALARRVGTEDDEAMCWYRYYDDCLWSSCERLH